MRRLWPWIVAGLLLSGMAGAAPVEVRSGEHAGFSRLVLEFADRPRWRIERQGRQVRILTDRPGPGFDLSDVFRYIPRTRLRAIRATGQGDGLILNLGCDCRVTGFDIREAAVVLDIVDPAAPPPSGPPTAGRATPSVAQSPARRPDLTAAETFPDIPDDATITALVDGPVQFLSGTDPEETAFEGTPPGGDGPPMLGNPGNFPILPLLETRPAPGAASEQLMRELARELGRAASQGLVRTAPLDIPEPLPEDAPPAPNVRIETAYDRIFNRDDPAQIVAEEIMGCRPESHFAITTWGDDRPMAEQLAERRAALVGEFDEPDPERVADLARLYIHFTFGIEARRLLEVLGSDVSERDHLLEMADLVESGGPGPASIGSQISCGGASGLFAILARANVPNDEVVDTDAILLTFIGMPAHLRRHLGPVLASRFAAAGDMLAVETISNAVARAAKPGSPPRVLSEAQIDPGDPENREALQSIASGVHPDASTALLVLVEDLISRGETIPQDMIDAAEILSFEQRGTQTSTDLKVAEIRARLTNGAFREAFHAIDGAAEEDMLSEDLLADMRELALETLIADADDSVFLTRILDPWAWEVALNAERSLRLAVASRLLQIGFPANAQTMAAPLADATSAEELRYGARLALAQNQPNRAIQFVRRMSGEDADRLLAEALAVAGRHGEAANAYDALGEAEAGRAEAWRGGEWDRLADEDASALGRAAQAYRGLGSAEDAPGEQPLTLERAEAALAGASDLRAVIDGMMEQVPPLPPG